MKCALFKNGKVETVWPLKKLQRMQERLGESADIREVPDHVVPGMVESGDSFIPDPVKVQEKADAEIAQKAERQRIRRQGKILLDESKTVDERLAAAAKLFRHIIRELNEDDES